MTGKREISRPARLENLSVIRSFIEESCSRTDAGQTACSDLRLAVDEACTNIIVHGYAGEEPGPIEVAFDEDAERIVVTITDRARSFSPDEIPPADVRSEWRERPVGGLGWHLIRESVDEVEYRPDPETGNRLTLIKRKPSA